MRRPTAIIMQGGAMRGAFGAGVLYEFAKRGCYVDTVAAASASVPSAFYYAARQPEEMRTIWTEKVGNNRFIRFDNLFLGKPIYDIDYLIENIFRDACPLSTSALANSPTRVVLPLYNYQKKTLEIRTSHDDDFAEHVWSYLRLAMIIHDRHILWGTPFEPYVDGALDPFALYKTKFLPEDARVLVIWNEQKFNMHTIKYIGQKLFLALQARHFPAEVKRMVRTRRALIDEGITVYNEFCTRMDPVVIKANDVFLAGLDVVSRNNTYLTRLFEEGREKARVAFDTGVLKDFL